MIANIAIILRLTNFFDYKKKVGGEEKKLLAIFGRSPCLIFLVEEVGRKKQKIPDIAIWDCLTN